MFISLIKGITGLGDISKFSRMGGQNDPDLYNDYCCSCILGFRYGTNC
ncbi:MAG: hypothetical protein LUH15_01030 [Tannerellaceae bacterium]|nr:hypothetical protein [Tannerellaceae bacterium]